MAGLQPAVVALIAAALLSASRSVFDMGNLFAEDNVISAAIVLSADFLCYKKKHPIIVIGMSALAGMLFGMLVWFMPRYGGGSVRSVLSLSPIFQP